jgi:hypothetical protein
VQFFSKKGSAHFLYASATSRAAAGRCSVTERRLCLLSARVLFALASLREDLAVKEAKKTIKITLWVIVFFM